MTQRTIAGLRFAVPSPSVYQLIGLPVQIIFANNSWWIECGGKWGSRPTLQRAAEDLAWVIKP